MSHYQEASIARTGDTLTVTVRSGGSFVCDAPAGSAPGYACSDPDRIMRERLEETLTAMGFRIVGKPGTGEWIVTPANTTRTFWDAGKREWRAFSGDTQENRPPLKVRGWMHRAHS